jgi:secreted trypsin-like serine protease
MRTVIKLVLAASVLSGCVIGEEGQDTQQGDENIIGGSLDYGDPAVGFLRNVASIDLTTGLPASVSMCTATLISPQVMLTAGHCHLQGAYWSDVTFANQTTDLFQAHNSPGLINAVVIPHPLWNGDPTQGHDVSIVLLSRPVYTRPVARGPVPAVGTWVTAVGYGLDVHGTGGGTDVGTGTKRHGSLNVTSTSGVHDFAAGHEGDNVCHGDSGGPVLQNGLQVGVTSFVDTADCHGGGHFEKIEDNLAFIHSYVPFY